MLTRVSSAGLLLPITALLAAAPPELLSRRGAVFTGARTASGSSSGATLTADGRQVIFVSDAPDLTVAPAEGRWLNVFRRDLSSGQTELVSRFGTNDFPGTGHSLGPTVSADGRRITFLSEVNDLTNSDTNQAYDVFVRRLNAEGPAVTELVSRRADGNGAGNGAVTFAEISSDGKFVLFESLASNLAAGTDANEATDVFLRNLETSTTIRLSNRTATNGAGNQGSRDPVMNRDASVVAFRSDATDLTAQVDGNVTDLYVWLRSDARLRRIAVPGPRISPSELPVRAMNPALSADGRYLAFRTGTGSAQNAINEIWWFDLVAGTNASASAGLTLTSGSGLDTATGPVMSADGRTIAFEALVNTNQPKVHLWKADSGLHTMDSLMSTGPPGHAEPATSESVTLSPDGSRVAFLTASPVPGTDITEPGDRRLVVRSLATGRTFAPPIGPNDYVYGLAYPEFSPDGARLLFQTEMVIGKEPDDNETFDVFLADIGTGQLSLISVSASAPQAVTPHGFSSTPDQCLSGDGRFVVFASLAENVLTGDTNAVRDVFRLDRQSGQTVLVSRGLTGQWGNGDSNPLQISPDGRFVLFSSHANNLVPEDTNSFSDIFLADLEGGSLALISAKDGGDASSAQAGSTQALISSDGQRVLFLTRASDLVSGVTGGASGNNLLLREPAQKRTRLLSRDTFGGLRGIQGQVTEFGFDGDGRRAYFVAGFGTARDVYQFDVAAAGLRRLTTNRSVLSLTVAPAGNRLAYVSAPIRLPRRLMTLELPGGQESTALELATSFVDPMRFSRDGSSLIFVTAEALPASRTGIEDTNTFSDVFHLDIVANVLRLASVGDYGQLGNGGANQPQISGDGRRVVFRSTASNLIAGDNNNFADAFLYDVASRRSTLLSANPATGRPANYLSTRPSLSDDGRFATFVSGASDLVAADFNGATDVFGLVLPAVATGDTDIDGMEDDWERTHFGSLTPTAEADADGDGRSNLDEFIADTNPVSAASFFAVTVSEPTANGVVLRWLSRTGVNYVIETAATPESGAFTAVGAPIVGDGLEKSVTLPAGETAGFIRVKAQR